MKREFEVNSKSSPQKFERIFYIHLTAIFSGYTVGVYDLYVPPYIPMTVPLSPKGTALVVETLMTLSKR